MKLLAPLLLSAAMLLPAVAAAERVTFHYRGVTVSDTFLAPAGTPVSGKFSWDPAAPVEVYGPPSYQFAVYTEPFTHGFSVRVGRHQAKTDNVQVYLYNDLGDPGSAVDMLSWSGSALKFDGQSFPDGLLGCQLVTAYGDTSALADFALPRKIDPARFQGHQYNECKLFFGLVLNEVALDFLMLDIRSTGKGHDDTD